MERQARDHVPALTVLLSAVSLALVFAAALRAVPAWVLPSAPAGVLAAIPHVNAAISALAIVVIADAWRSIRQGDIARHRRGMLAGVVLFAAFLSLYLYKVALTGPTAFPGPTTVERLVYLPTLAIHVLLAVVCVPLLYYVLLLAVTRPVSELPSTNHPLVGRVAVALWLVSFALGLAVYVLLYVVY
jgi:putative membrane protein